MRRSMPVLLTLQIQPLTAIIPQQFVRGVPILSVDAGQPCDVSATAYMCEGTYGGYNGARYWFT
jgi:hypothetical protein